MRILLVGEYSRLHNSLKEGLQELGHKVTLVSTGDQFKKFPSDILLNRRYHSGFSKKIKVGIYKMFGIDITSISLKNQFFSYKEEFKDFDVVQLINESPFSIAAKEEREMISFLKNNNKKLFLLSCGADYSSIKYAYDKKLRYSTLSPFFDGKVSEKDSDPALKYLRPEFVSLHKFIFEEMNGVIASDLDYHIPLKGHEKYLGLIPNPINTSKLKQLPFIVDNKIIIFHGINRGNYFKKGNDYFEAALRKIEDKYHAKVEIITVESVPYSEYISAYNSAHILLDQVFFV
ncbi:glycosyltransferase family protein [Aequorivita ciconiae]|uniref:glycosyltransferase family 1 protein n=1 Tax=Aequorivita ciconiae TaxID=2494375 RepID=UPI0026CC9309|nr:glycosyltransferase family 1 protein [Aequorivita sp. H23M31]